MRDKPTRSEPNQAAAAIGPPNVSGFWIFGKKRLIPAGVIERVDDIKKKVFVSMTKDRVKSAPDFDELQRSTYDDRYYDSVDSYYGSYRDW